MNLRMLLSITLLLAWASNALAAQSIHDDVATRLTNRWVVSNLSRAQTENGTIESRVFERFSYPDDALKVYLGNITYLKLPKPKNQTGESTTAAVIKILNQSMHIAWHLRKQGKTQVYEGFWQKPMRYIRVFTRDDGDSIAVSVANFRMPYMESANEEVELIQRKLMGELDGKSPALDQLFSYINFILSPLTITSAYAQLPPKGQPSNSGNCGCPPLDQACAMNCSTNNLNQFATSINNATSATNNASNNVTGAINAYQPKADRANTVGEAGVKVANQGVEEWHRTNDIAQEGLDWAKQQTEPDKIAAFVAVTTATAVLTASVVGVLAQGVVSAIESGIEAITHAKDNAARLAAYQAALKIYENYPTQAQELERRVDQMLNYLILSRSVRKDRETLLSVEALIAKREDFLDNVERLREKKRAILNDPEQDACRRELNVEITKAQAFVDMIDLLQKTGGDTVNETTMCNNVIRSLNALKDLESTIQAARAAIIDGWDRALAEQGAQDKKTAEGFKNATKRADSALEIETQSALDAAYVEHPEYKNARSNYLRTCMRSMIPTSGIPIIGPMISGLDKAFSRKFHSVEEKCQHAWNESEYNKSVMRIAKQRIDLMQNSTDDTHAVADQLKTAQALALARRESMHATYNDAKKEQLCIEKKPACDTVWYARHSSLLSRLADFNETLLGQCGRTSAK